VFTFTKAQRALAKHLASLTRAKPAAVIKRDKPKLVEQELMSGAETESPDIGRAAQIKKKKKPKQ
jgi:hypothetical protein